MTASLYIFSRRPDGQASVRPAPQGRVQREAGRLVASRHTDIRIGDTEGDALPLSIWQVARGRMGENRS